MSLWDYIVWPFARLMELLYNWTQNYGLSVILFAFVVNFVLLPFMAKSKKSMMRTSRFQPKMKELEERHKGNQQKYQEELRKLYREENISPTSGCLWSLIPFPILIALYGVIRQPLTRMMGIAADGVEKITDWAIKNAGYVAETRDTYAEIGVVDAIHQKFDAAVSALGDFAGKFFDVDYSFLGVSLGEIPDFRIWDPSFAEGGFAKAFGLFMIPIIAAFLSWLSIKISQKTNPTPTAGGQQAQMSMKTMNVMMPVMSIWICFMMPAALGVYWIANSIFGILRDVSLTKIYKKQLDAEDAERIARDKARAAELQARREETERLRAEGATTRNTNTSKKKMQAQQKQSSDERRAANERIEREAKRERRGIAAETPSPSQVGKRRYARGRAYDPDRFGTSFDITAETEIPELDGVEPETESFEQP